MNKRDMTMQRKGLVARWLQALLTNCKGVAAIEFALIAPLLLTLYFVTMEVAQGMETNKKVSRVGSMVADLVGQQGFEVYTEDLDAIMVIGGAVLKPYTRSSLDIIITGIEIDEDSKAKVKWSRRMQDGIFSRDEPKGTLTTVTDDLKIPKTFLLRVTARLDYRPIISWTADQKIALGLLGAFDNIKMSEKYDLRPRMTAEMNCPDC